MWLGFSRYPQHIDLVHSRAKGHDIEMVGFPASVSRAEVDCGKHQTHVIRIEFIDYLDCHLGFAGRCDANLPGFLFGGVRLDVDIRFQRGGDTEFQAPLRHVLGVHRPARQTAVWETGNAGAEKAVNEIGGDNGGAGVGKVTDQGHR